MIMRCMSEINVRSAAQGRKNEGREKRKDRSRMSRCQNVFKEKIRGDLEDRLVLFIHLIYLIQSIIWCLLSFSQLAWGATTL